jgi:polysaccharide export outer membrane protein
LAGGSVLLLCACASSKGPKFQTLGELTETSDGIGAGQNIRLRSGDSIDVRLGGVPREEIDQVTGTYTVDTQGFVNMPQIGRIRASGATQEQLQATIEAGYRKSGIYTRPTITVGVPIAARFVNIGGEVRLPQRVPYTPDLTVLSSITAAGGFTEYASQSKVRLYRGTEVSIVNMKRIRNNPALDIPLEPGDTVEVMRSFF